jgi:hypothetical protein
MNPELVQGLLALSGLCITAKLAAVKMAIRTEYETQKAAAIDAGVDPSQFTRKLNDAEPFTFREFDRLSEEAQKVALLEMLAQMGLPQRVKRWLSIAQAIEGSERRSA